MDKNQDFLLLMLERVLLEIRNLGDSEIDKAKALAYIFHNIPAILRHDFNEQKGRAAFQVIQGRARYFELTQEIEKWEQWALKALSK